MKGDILNITLLKGLIHIRRSKNENRQSWRLRFPWELWLDIFYMLSKTEAQTCKVLMRVPYNRDFIPLDCHLFRSLHSSLNGINLIAAVFRSENPNVLH